MKPGALRVLKELDADENCDLVSEGIVVYCGQRQTSHAVLTELLGLMAVSVAYKDSTSSYTVYRLNETGQALLRNPDFERKLLAALASRKPFMVKDDDIVEMKDPSP